MSDEEVSGAASAAIASQVTDFYESHPYPPPVDDLEAYRKLWDEPRRRADSHLIWPHEPYRDDRTILVAGCGTTQAAHYALRWPRALPMLGRRTRLRTRCMSSSRSASSASPAAIPTRTMATGWPTIRFRSCC